MKSKQVKKPAAKAGQKGRMPSRGRNARSESAADLEKLFYLAAIVDSTGEAIFSQNMDGIITTWNTGARQLFGYAEAEAVGQSALILVPESMRTSTLDIFEKLRRGEPIEHLETVRVRKDGGVVDVSLTISAIKDANGRPMGASSIAYDITERKKIEDERIKMIQQLNETLSKVRTLSGLLPICASCKKIRDDRGYWQKLETFVREHSNAEFSHSMCPECMERLYPDFAKHKGS